MDKQEVKEILCQQLQLLAEKSIDADAVDLVRLSGEMDRIANTILREC